MCACVCVCVCEGVSTISIYVGLFAGKYNVGLDCRVCVHIHICMQCKQAYVIFIHSFILNIYIAPLHENYSEALPTPARSNKAVLR